MDKKEEKCPTCQEVYSQPPTDKAYNCLDLFHLCRDCVWENGKLIERCVRCSEEEGSRDSPPLEEF